MKTTVEIDDLIELKALIHAQVAEDIAQQLKGWQIPETFNASQREGARHQLTQASKILASGALQARKSLSPTSKAHKILEMMEIKVKSDTRRSVDPMSGNGPNGQYTNATAKR